MSSSGPSAPWAEIPAPPLFNWMTQKPRLNTEVVNQEDCNACWAIATTTAAGYLYYLQNEEVDDFRLSAQELMDRVITHYPQYFQNKTRDRKGCYTAKPWIGYQFMKDHGVRFESDYPFVKEFKDAGPIREDERPRVKIHDYVKLETRRDIIKALKVQPLTGGVNVTHAFRNYNGEGVCKEGGTSVAKHAVVIVGMNVKENYYLIRNSWGKEWGRGGYALVPCSMVSHIYRPLPPVTTIN